jgi:hypothetical protein
VYVCMYTKALVQYKGMRMCIIMCICVWMDYPLPTTHYTLRTTYGNIGPVQGCVMLRVQCISHTWDSLYTPHHTTHYTLRIYHTTPHYTTLHTTQHYTTHYTTLNYTLHYTTHYTTLHHTTPHYTTLHHTLHYTTPHHTALDIHPTHLFVS